MRLNRIVGTLLFFVNLATLAATFSTATPVLISIENVSKLFSQCSRTTPSPTGKVFQANQDEIRDTDTAVAKYLADRRISGQRLPPQNQKYFVQYVKYSIGKEQFIYGNYFPQILSEELMQNGNAVLFCDGGSSFWGASYDLQTKQVISIEFNGP